jgi:hypothetical protein
MTDTSIDINYSSDVEIAGFQFSVSGVTLTGAVQDGLGSVSFGNGTVIGFDLAGGALPAGDHVLASLTFDGQACGAVNLEVDGVILSGPTGGGLVTSGPGSTGVDNCSDWDGDCICDDVDDCDFGDVSLSFENQTQTSVDIVYNSNVSISGTQFIVSGVNLTNVTDGDLDIVSFNPANGAVILFDGDGVPAAPGSGVLAHLEFEAELNGALLEVSDVIVGTSGANESCVDGPGSTAIDACDNNDGDDFCDIYDDDDDNDGVADGDDSHPFDNTQCSDTDGDSCDD